jgi:hypothetical protein
MFRGSCPRCHYRKPADGKSVYTAGNEPDLLMSGGHGGGGGTPIATARGTAQNKTSSTTFTLSVTIALAGSSVLISLGYDATGALVSSATCGATTLSQIGPTQGSANLNQEQWAGLGVAAGTQTITFNFQSAAIQKCMTVIEVTNLGAQDRQTNAGGVSTNPNSGNTATTQQVSEFLWGTVVTNGPYPADVGGTWQNSFTEGQRDGTTGGIATTNVAVSEGYRLVSVTGAYKAEKIGITNRDWGALISTWRTA